MLDSNLDQSDLVARGNALEVSVPQSLLFRDVFGRPLLLPFFLLAPAVRLLHIPEPAILCLQVAWPGLAWS